MVSARSNFSPALPYLCNDLVKGCQRYGLWARYNPWLLIICLSVVPLGLELTHISHAACSGSAPCAGLGHSSHSGQSRTGTMCILADLRFMLHVAPATCSMGPGPVVAGALHSMHPEPALHTVQSRPVGTSAYAGSGMRGWE